MSPLSARASSKGNRKSLLPQRSSVLEEGELDDYDFYSSDHLDKIFDVVIEIQEEYDKKRLEDIKLQQSQKADQEKVPKALLNPEVQRQIKKQKVYKPYFLVTLTVIQVIIMFLELGINWVKLGTPIDLNTENFNIMLGPSTSVLIHFGARWVPCMRSGFENESISCIDGVDPYMNVTVNSQVFGICKLSDLCGMGMAENTVPNQWWRFITPIFLHAGIIHIITNLLFQIRVGFQMERDFGTLRIFIIYSICGIAGFMFGAEYTIQTPSVGCSGSLYGLIACLLLDLLLNWKLLIKPVKELFKMLFVIIISLGVGFLPFVDNFAHVGGFVTGLITGLIFLPSIKFNLKDRIIKKTITIISIPVLVIIMSYLIISFYSSDARRCEWCKYANCLPINGWCDDMI
ncbi:rhomboid-domain-containing protein [Neocallimastix lanati (nom. inval.)]|uniref:Rhomboid-type serine protease n=1 Tax=Neocallimastix californiae TaxID=1754190 RepID=A0A1Y2F042_9FUNG|nr:rhomboid-domain-containing protein [Neocallimastix sp. JGI-2020a]ORY76736.1 rhomboid-domain-containing protein [Neocallimastix californiae]|eukprot:ORY76736.1 rhomboid-domain-containing protein [Neocallimastix californiae]